MAETKPVDVLLMLESYRAVCDDYGRVHEQHEIDSACAAVAELVAAAQALSARTFEDARDNEGQRLAAERAEAPTYPPPELLWCRADVLNPCWSPGRPYTGKHWGWTPDMGDSGEVCEHCRLRAALAAFGGAA